MNRLMMTWMLVVLVSTASVAENYDIPDATTRQMSTILGEPMIATQRMPDQTSIQMFTQGGEPFVRFTLKDGDIGGAPTDNDPAHGRVFDRPYSERAELRMDSSMRRDSIYEIMFQVRFVEGFEGEAETFFQIHTGQKPPLMFFFRDFGRTHLLANLMQGCLRTCGHNDEPEFISHKTIYPRSQMFGRWHEFRIVTDTSNSGSMSIYFNGTLIALNQPVTFPSQHRPHVKLGMYRAGDLDGNATSTVDYRALNITRLGASE